MPEMIAGRITTVNTFIAAFRQPYHPASYPPLLASIATAHKDTGLVPKAASRPLEPPRDSEIQNRVFDIRASIWYAFALLRAARPIELKME